MTDLAKIYDQTLSAFNGREWQRVLQLGMPLLRTMSENAGLHYMLGVASLELGQLQAAARHMGYAATLEPGNSLYGSQFARILSACHLTAEALAEADRTLALAPADAMQLDTLGVVYTLANAHQKACEAFTRATTLAPHSAHYHYNLASSLIAMGRLDDAERELETCIALDPSAWRAHFTLAHARRQTPQRHHRDRLEQRLADAADNDLARMYMQLALAKECEDLGDYGAAFDHLSKGKAAGGRGRGYRRERDRALFDALIKAFPGTDAAAEGHDSGEPLFIIGMPRSGTTLVERIVSNHPDVQTASELQNFGLVLKRLSGSRTPLLLDEDTIMRALSVDPAQLGRHYIASTRPGTGARPRFIDKLPQNFLYAGFIARALPNARIICLRRDPMDTCLSNFRQLFSLTTPHYDYSFDLEDTGHYYVGFDRLMAHWQRVLPGRILEVDYEALVDDQAGQSRRIIDFCGLDWNDACLHFHENSSPVSTASAVQVREPMNRRSLQRWKRYGAPMDALRLLLEHEGIAVRD
ncbi:Tetratricopeptide repeat-containing protein [Dyella jiangningensis]|uniref:tetratricopeptide repeat-containing sulfotransferase family protein n=1 Tax=Dyella sp. AtDHG13 TaxID=1938897 RepID=UPI00088462C3|nr:sulfotransferase [Dyella sp. AtDHG13]PXV53282.1 tetratricopeptide repeat protein [Dyella sp. AtDHG13]SDL35672.1 Tetratricopeptide repeat-containing protein [Dyella jiangningensis]